MYKKIKLFAMDIKKTNFIQENYTAHLALYPSKRTRD